MHKVSKKKKKRKQTFKPATGCAASYGSGSNVEILLSCRKGCNIKTRQQEQGMVWQ